MSCVGACWPRYVLAASTIIAVQVVVVVAMVVVDMLVNPGGTDGLSLYS